MCPASKAPCVRQHPFIDGIMETPMLKGWRGIHLDKYDSSTDPDEHLANYLTQRESEPLRSFVVRFSDIFVKICNLNLEVALHSIIMALKSRSFSNSLCKLLPKDMDDLRMRASGYIHIEEMVKFYDRVCVEKSSAPRTYKDHKHLSRTNAKKGRSEGLAREPKFQGAVAEKRTDTKEGADSAVGPDTEMGANA
ncbi:hypothetical protein CR513_55343, partial [Mucuna pruriens]